MEWELKALFPFRSLCCLLSIELWIDSFRRSRKSFRLGSIGQYSQHLLRPHSFIYLSGEPYSWESAKATDQMNTIIDTRHDLEATKKIHLILIFLPRANSCSKFEDFGTCWHQYLALTLFTRWTHQTLASAQLYLTTTTFSAVSLSMPPEKSCKY